jgi:hypothetical protein
MSEVHLIETEGGRYIDLYPNESISQNWKFTDIADFSTRGSFSREFRIPATNNNAQIFGYLDNANFTPTDNYFHKKLPCELRVNTIPIAIGHIRTMRAITQAGVLTDIELTFYAETPDLTRALGDKKLKDIAALADLNHVVGYDNVTTETDEYIYALCDRGQKWSEGGESGTRQVYNPSAPVYPADLTPCVNWRYLLEKIIEEAGFTLDASILLPIIEGYWMPFTVNRWLQYTQAPEQYFFRAILTADQTVSNSGYLSGFTEIFDNHNDFSGSAYTAPFTGYFTFNLFFTVNVNGTNNTGGTVQARLRRTSPTVGTVATTYPLSISAQQANGSDEINLQYTTPAIFLNSGDVIEYFVEEQFQNSVTFQGGQTDPALGTGWALVNVSGSHFGETLDFQRNAPDMKQIDFIRDIIWMHNCAVIPDRTIPNKMKIVPMIDYLTTGDALDWTGKIDLSKDIVIQPTTDYQKRTLKWSYKSGGDVASKLFQDVGLRTYGEYKVDGYTINPTEEPNDFANGEQNITLNTISTPCVEINATGIVIPKFVNGSGEFVNPGPRCLYNADTAQIQLYDNDTANAAVLTSVNLLNHYSDINADISDFDLNFAPETPLHGIQSNPYNNLFNRYWRAYMNELYSPEARIMEAYFALSLTDVLTLDFSDTIFIKDSYWRILSVDDYKVGLNEVTKVVLIKIINTGLDCPIIPTGTNGDKYVDFVDANGDPALPTEACCTRYGYVWNEELSACLAPGLEIPKEGRASEAVGKSFGAEAPDYTISMMTNAEISRDAVLSVFAGNSITVEEGNKQMLAVGDTLTLEGEQRGSNMLGKNVLTNMPGLHLGGGWMSDDRESPAGGMQHGTVILGVKGGFTTSSDRLELLIESISGKRINIPDKTSLACVLTVNMVKVSGSAIINSAHGVFTFRLSKATTASASAVNTVTSVTDYITLGVEIDTATDTDEHRLKIATTGSGYAHTDNWITATLQYTQVRHE